MVYIKYKDIDPDTGNITAEVTMASCGNYSHAKAIVEALGKADDEPNREYYISEPKKEKEQAKINKKQSGPPPNNGYTAYGDIKF